MAELSPYQSAIQLGLDKGRKLISTEDQFKKKQLKWQCAVCSNINDTFSVNNMNFAQAGGCGSCNHKSTFEAMCREITYLIIDGDTEESPYYMLELNTRQVISPRELDIYITHIKTAVEVHGKQHYSNTHQFHKGRTTTFAQTTERDEERRDLCNAKGIALVEVLQKDALCFKTLAANIYDGIREQRPDAHLINRDRILTREFQYQVYERMSKYDQTFIEYEKTRLSCEDMGYELISKSFDNTNSRIQVKCDKGHIWETTPNNINCKNRERRCGHCYGKVKFTDAEVITNLQDLGFTWESGVYNNSSDCTLVVKCTTCNKTLEKKSLDNLTARGCNECNGGVVNRILTLERFKERVHEVSKGSIECITNGDPNGPANTGKIHKFKCTAKNHEFSAKGLAYSTDNGGRCHACTKEKKTVPENGHIQVADHFNSTCLNRAPLKRTDQKCIFQCANNTHPPLTAAFNNKAVLGENGTIKLKPNVNQLCLSCVGKRNNKFNLDTLLEALRNDQILLGNDVAAVSNNDILELYNLGRYKK